MTSPLGTTFPNQKTSTPRRKLPSSLYLVPHLTTDTYSRACRDSSARRGDIKSHQKKEKTKGTEKIIKATETLLH